ncbi:MAG: hypothetical protein IT440_02285 [Phycisphaeraceae bacterium]|nr:hypothetical protein [Phycisphaeraceae bacterium]
MNMIQVAIVSLGHLKHRIDFSRIRSWKSTIFSVCSVSTQPDIQGGDAGWQTFRDNQLNTVELVSDANITVAITEYALEDNYYMRKLPSSVIVLSLYETAEFLERHNIPLEHFIIRNIYELCLLFHLYPNDLPPTRENVPDIIHDETRSCLFDMNGVKSDVVFSTSCPSLCHQCQARVARAQLPEGIISCLEKELRKIRKPMYYRITDFVKQHPILSLLLTLIVSFAMELAGNGVYDWLIG